MITIIITEISGVIMDDPIYDLPPDYEPTSENGLF